MILEDNFIVEPTLFKDDLISSSNFVSIAKYYWPYFFVIDKTIISRKITNLNLYNKIGLVKFKILIGSIFYFNLKKWKPNYALINSDSKLVRTYSTGFILKLYSINLKKFRRSTKHLTSFHFKFFKSYLPVKKKFEIRMGLCSSYKRRYSLLILKGLIPFAKTHLTNILFLTKLLTTPYTWRRVSPIKKRIRKRLKIDCKVK